MIHLSPITADDMLQIKTWPAYRNGFEPLDYALRQGGWLDEFTGRPGARIYTAWFDKKIAGFSLLSTGAPGAAEFRIAVHPDLTGRGLGRKIAQATLETGFLKHHLDRIYLIVRKNNIPAWKLYESLGFEKIGESTHTIRERPIEFFDMDLTRNKFLDMKEIP